MSGSEKHVSIVEKTFSTRELNAAMRQTIGSFSDKVVSGPGKVFSGFQMMVSAVEKTFSATKNIVKIGYSAL